ncbi:hypothetical protein PsorP6_000925 [Peronosclerospora sorghi]|uniref:Uncharacterized protein n=1 Tax=Peronosclerospora sorghi TaxID=230839 RepID=A0ACC0WQI9_9STRA|nr:hypothetical protein PsorP6_000925 [Peronosclerospora sorghi]
MKASPLVASCLVAVSIVTVGARQMHAGINYQRYLAEVDTTEEDLRSWKAAFWHDNEWLPDFAEERSSEDIDEDLRQRIFMSKQDVLEAQAANPHANFSLMTKFSALTKEEFSARVLNSFVQSDANPQSDPKATERSLRQTFTYTYTSVHNAQGQHIAQGQTGGSWAVGTVKPAAVRPIASPTPARASFRAPNVASPRAATTRAPIHAQPKRIPVVPAPMYQFHATAPAARAPVQLNPTPAYRPATARPSTRWSSIPVQAKKQVVTTTKSSLDWSRSQCMAPIQAQGQCSSCWAFAAVAAVESLQCIKGGQVGINKYSEQQIVGCVSRNKGCGGGAAVYAYDYIAQNGLCSANSYPYTLANGGPKTCRASCSKIRTGITGYERLDQGNEAQLINALQWQPVVAAVASGNAAWKQYTGGVLSSCQTTRIDHAVLIVGYDATTFKIRNSWGQNWGENGYMRLQRTSGLDVAPEGVKVIVLLFLLMIVSTSTTSIIKQLDQLNSHPCTFAMGLLSLILIFTTCGSSIVSAQDIVLTTHRKKVSNVVTNASDVKSYLQGRKRIVPESEDEARASLSDVTSLLQKIPNTENLRTSFFQKKPAVVTDTSSKKGKDQGDKGYEEVTKLEAWKIVIKGQLKPLAIIAAIALIGGYIAYLVNG